VKASERLYAKAERALREGRADEAERLAGKLVEKAPRYAAGWSLLGTLAQRRRDLEAAIRHFRQAASLRPAEPVFHNNLGNACREAQRLEEAAASLEEALRLDPGYAAAHNNLGLVQLAMGRAEDAVSSFERAIEARPKYAKAHHNLGTALRQRGELAAAVASFREALRLEPFYAKALNGLGVALRELGEHPEALDALGRALELKPDYAEAALNQGVALAELTRYQDALRSFRRALALRPGYTKALIGQGAAFERSRNCAAAVESYSEAVRTAPDSADAHFNLGNALRATGALAEACRAFETALELDPDHGAARANRLDARSELCDWRERDRDVEWLQEATRTALEAGEPPPLSASAAHRVVPSTAAEQLAIARDAAERLQRRLSHVREGLAFDHGVREKQRLRLGYLSCDFRHNAVGHLTQGLFGRHDRTRFEVLAYSYGPDDGSAYRRRFEADADRFVDIAALSDEQAARRIHEDGVDVLVDLVGCAGNGRMEIAALRPAPLQVHFLGFPATTGAPFIDYFVSDTVVTPPEEQRSFQERLVLLPDCYQVNDSEQPIAEGPPARAGCGLPEPGFVYCCFNANYKIIPSVFDIWMRLLRRVPGSVLWLIETTPGSAENLRREAQERGVAPGRLVFAERAPKPEHLARHGLADLFLDTWPCNAHTTASDALWAGVPLLTCPGEVFASRVAASLLTAVGLPELIAADLGSYEETAVRLAQRPDQLAALRRRLWANRLRRPLFDTGRFVRHLERAYLEMWRIHCAGEAPRTLSVAAEAPVEQC
jgi:predicted O-linked N-acetylglucosamine transferase (SPINDLY family)